MRILLLLLVGLMASSAVMAQKTDVINCGAIEKRNNGNGQYASCAGVYGNLPASNVIGTKYENFTQYAPELKTGDINIRYTGNVFYPCIITRVWIGSTLSNVVAGPPAEPVRSGGRSLVTYCFYGQNLPPANVITLEFTDPQTGKPVMRCSYDPKTGEPTTPPTGICEPLIVTQPSNTVVCSGDSARIKVEAFGVTNYQWQVSTDGTTFTNLTEGGDYRGVTDTMLVIGNPSNYNGRYYRVVVSAYNCATTVTSTRALLTAYPAPNATLNGSATYCGTGTTRSLRFDLTGTPPFQFILTTTPSVGSVTRDTFRNINTSTYYVAVTPSVSTQYQVTSVSDLYCSKSNPSNTTVNVYASPTASVNNASVCYGSSSFNLTYSSLTGGANRYSIAAGTRAVPSFAAVTNVVLGSSPISVTIPDTTRAGTYDFNITFTNATASCGSTTIAFTLTVNGLPTVGASRSADSVCANTGVTLTATGASTYSWSPSTYLSATTGSTVTSTPTVANQTTTYTVTGTDGNGCSAQTTIAVRAKVAGGSLTFSPTNPSTCANGSTAVSVSGGSGTSYSWSVQSGSGTVSPSSGTTVIASPGASATTYAVVGTSATGCPASGTVTVTVNAAPTITFTNGARTTMCEGTSDTLTASGGTSYYWSPSTGLYTDPALTTAYTGATSTATVYAKPTSTTIYTVTGYNAGGCSSTNTATVTLASSPFTTASTETPLIFCEKDEASFVVTAATSSSQVITWAYSTTENGTYNSFTTAVSPTGATFTPSPTGSTSTTSKTVTVSGYNKTSYAGPEWLRARVTTGGCTFDHKVNIVAINKINTGSPAPIAIINPVCSGSTAQLYVSSTAGTAVQWQQSTNSTSWTNTGTGLDTLTTGTLTANMYYRVAYDRGSCASTTLSTLVTVNTIAANTISITTPSNGCSDGSTTLSLAGTNVVTGANYQWQSSTDNVNFSNIPAATSQGYSSSAYLANQTTYFRRLVVSGACSTSTSNTITIYPPVRVSAGSDQAVCSGTSMSQITSSVAGGTGSYSYAWQSASSFAGTYSAATGTNNTNSYSPGIIGSNTYYRLVVTSGSCTGTSNIVSKLINALPTITVNSSSSPISVSYCSGSSATLTASGAGTGGSYSWTNSGTLSSASGAVVVSTATSNTSHVVTGTNGNGCSNTATVNITVNAKPTTPTVTNSSVTTCTNAYELTGNVSSTQPANHAYQWQSVPANPADGYILGTTNVTTSGTYYLYSKSNTTNCYSDARTVTVAVLNLAQPTVAATSITGCTPATADLTSLQPAAVTGAVYNWYSDNTHTTPVSNAEEAGSGTYYLFAYSAAGNCYSSASSAVNVAFTTTPGAPVTAADPGAVCEPNTINLNSLYTPNGVGNTYQWHTVASNPTPSTLIQDPTEIDASGNYYVYAINNGCMGVASDGITVTINPLPTAVLGVVNPTCNGGGTTISVTTNATGASYAWEVQQNLGTTWSTVSNGGNYSGATTNTLALASSTGYDGMKYRAIVTTTAGCSTTSYFVNIIEDEIPVIATEPVAARISQDSSGIFYITRQGLNSGSYQWQVSTNGGTSYTNLTEGSPYLNVNGMTLVVDTATLAMSGNYYRCYVTTTCGSDTSLPATLTVTNVPPPTLAGEEFVWYKYEPTDTVYANPDPSYQELRWYTNPSGGTYTTTAPVPPSRYSGYQVYFVSQVIAGVESGRVPVFVRIKPVTWYGGTNVTWGVGNNWRGGRVPPPGDSVYIESIPNHNPQLDSNRVIGELTFGDNTPIDLNKKKLTILGGIYGNASFQGDSLASLEIRSAAVNTISFVNDTAGNHRKRLKDLIIDTARSHIGADTLAETPWPTTTPEIGLGSNLDIYGELRVTTGRFTLNRDTLTFKSDSAMYPKVGQFGILPDEADFDEAEGVVCVERFVPKRRANRLMTPSVNSFEDIRHNWQEGVNNTTFMDSLAPTASYNPNPGFGTHITGSKTGANGFDATQTANPSVWTYSLSNGWVPLPNTNVEKLYAAKPYRVIIRGDRSIKLRTNNPAPKNTVLRAWGHLIKGDHTVPLSSTPGEWNLVGNPYAAAVDLSALSYDNAIPQIYIFDPNMNNDNYWTQYLNYSTGSYVVYDLDLDIKSNASSEMNRVLQPGQAFWVRTSPSGGPASLTFRETHKYVGDTMTRVWKTNSALPTLYVQLYANGVSTNPASDGFAVLFDSSYSNGFVLGEDAGKLTNSAENISSRVGTNNLMIDKRKHPVDGDSIQLNITGYMLGQYALKLYGDNYSYPNMSAVLYDRHLNIEHPLSSNGATEVTYTVPTAAAKAWNRFVIRFKANLTLPVTLVNVKAYRKDNNVQVEWTTENEVNMKQYVVEKSVNGADFKAMSTVEAKGSVSLASYNVLDNSPVMGYNYYRIKAISSNGSFQYSNIVRVNLGKESSIAVYPNPVRDNVIMLEMSNIAKGDYVAELYNNLGQMVFSSRISHTGSSVQSLKVGAGVTAGIYNLRISGNGEQRNIKVMME